MSDAPRSKPPLTRPPPATLPTAESYAPTTQLSGPAYAVQLHRAARAGDAYNLHTVMIMTANGTIAGPAQTTVERHDLRGRVDVVSVDAAGQQTAFFTHSAKLHRTGRELIPAGKTIDFQRAGKSLKFSLRGGGGIGGDAQDTLNGFFGRSDSTPDNEDDLFGSKPPRRAGESWPVDPAVMRRVSDQSGGKIQFADVSGHATLTDVEMVRDAAALRIAASVRAKIGVKDVPLGLHVDRADLRRNLTILAPVQRSLPVIEEENNMDMPSP